MSKEQRTSLSTMEGRASCVRLTEKEYLRLKRDEMTSGKSIPWLLKASYFEKDIVTPTLDVESRKAALRELGRIGCNLNQLVKQVNCGLISECKAEVDEMRNIFRTFKSFLGLDHDDATSR